MALDPASRWRTIREVILNRKSGTLVLQLGKNYLHWIIDTGEVVCVSSSSRENSLTAFITNGQYLALPQVAIADASVNETTSLGAALLQTGMLDREKLRNIIRDHCVSLSHYLFQTAYYLFWSDQPVSCKQKFIKVSIPLSHIILSAERSNIETTSALRVAKDFPKALRLKDGSMLETPLQTAEMRILHYLKVGSSLEDILHEPDLDRITCYRVLFLLWLAAKLQEPRIRPAAGKASTSPRIHLWNRIRSLPPEWIFPLLAGVMIGVLLSPGPHIEAKKEQPQKTEKLKDVLQKPAWRTE
jgi:hypothetical protein